MKRNTWLKPVALLVIIFALFQSGKTRRQDFYIRIYEMQDGVRGALVKSVEGPLRKVDDYAPQINELVGILAPSEAYGGVLDPSGALYEITIGPVGKDKNDLIYFVYFQDGRILLRIENSASGTPLYQVAARPPEAFLTYIDS